jgi:N6-L-threonylcarbamoyladenine synthase
MLHSGDLDFSFSGLKTAVVMQVKGRTLDAQARADIAAEFQAAIVDVLVAKSLSALERCAVDHLVVAGGVGANAELRARLNRAAAHGRFKVFFPPAEFCTDNGAMIAFAGALRMSNSTATKVPSDGAFSVRPRWDLATLAHL